MWSLFGHPIDRIKWRNVVFIGLFHALAVCAFFRVITGDVKPLTLPYLSVLMLLGGLGITIAGHRYYSHRAFKARFPLRCLLIAMYSTAINGSALSYARDHRAHHKWSDSDGDPGTSKRGFFFCHMGWWLLKKDKIVLELGKKLDLKDLYCDPIVTLQHKYYPLWALIFGIVLPPLVPIILWNENIVTAFLLCVPYRTVVVWHHSWSSNSLSHWLGWKPYNRNTLATDNYLLNYIMLGEGDHNFHHTFAQDYRTSELSVWRRYCPTTLVINIFAAIGLAYDLKVVPKHQIERTVERTGNAEEWKRKDWTFSKWSGAIDWALGLMIAAHPVHAMTISQMF